MDYSLFCFQGVCQYAILIYQDFQAESSVCKFQTEDIFCLYYNGCSYFKWLQHKSGLTLHDFHRTTDQIGCEMSRRVITSNHGK